MHHIVDITDLLCIGLDLGRFLSRRTIQKLKISEAPVSASTAMTIFYLIYIKSLCPLFNSVLLMSRTILGLPSGPLLLSWWIICLQLAIIWRRRGGNLGQFLTLQHQLHVEIYLAYSTANGSFGVSDRLVGDQYVYERSRHIAVKMPLGLTVRVTEQVRACKWEHQIFQRITLILIFTEVSSPCLAWLYGFHRLGSLWRHLEVGRSDWFLHLCALYIYLMSPLDFFGDITKKLVTSKQSWGEAVD